MVDSGSNWSICPESLIPKQYRWSEVPIPENLNLVGISGGRLKGTVLAAAVIKIGEVLVKTDFYLTSDQNTTMKYCILGLGILKHLKTK